MACIKILQWNVQCLLNNCRELKQSAYRNKYDVICIQETRLKPDRKYDLPGYNSVRNDREGAVGGGLITYIKNGLKFAVLDRPEAIECQVIRIMTDAGGMTVANVYLPPSTEFGTAQAEAFGRLFEHGDASIIVGDLNAKSRLWRSPVNDARGEVIAGIAADREFVALNDGTPTRLDHARGSASHIDVTFASSRLAAKCRWAVLNNAMGSDHNPILITINERPVRESSSVPRWKLEQANWSIYETECNRGLTIEHASDDDVEQFNSKVVGAIRAAAEAAVPQTGVRAGNRVKPLPYWNEDIRAAIYQRNRARNKFKRSRLLDDGIEYKRLKSVARRLVRDAAQQYWRQYCSTLTSQARLSTVWSMARRMSGTRCSPASTSLADGDRLIERDGDKAEFLAKKFAEVSSSSNYSPTFRTRKDDVEQNHAHLFANDAPETEMSRHLNAEFSFQELAVALGEVKRKSSPGEDRVTYEFLQRLPDTGKHVVLRLFNAIWRTGHVPKSWKHAIVVPILKVGKDPHLAGSYRPISLTSSMCKLMERLVANRLQWYLERHQLLSNVQSGFRRNRGTMDHVVRLQDTVVRQLNNRGHVLAVFLDMEKAYDMVWQRGLMIKLKKFGVNGCMFRWIEAFLSDRTIQVKVGAALSQVHKLENGTAQGSMLSPLAFISMIDDLAKSLKQVEVALFADDSTIYKAGGNLPSLTDAVQRALDSAAEWADQWGFRISAAKTVAVLFSRCATGSDIELTIGGTAVKVEKSAKFLGVIFDRRLSWGEHIDYVRGKCQKRLNLMRSIVGTTWGANRKMLLTIYRALVRSVLDYGSMACDGASKTQLAKLQLIQNQALRLCCGAMRCTSVAAIQVECGEMPLHLRRRQQQMKFAVKVKATSGHVAKKAFEEHWTTYYGKFAEHNRPVAVKVDEYFKQRCVSGSVAGPQWAIIPPWTAKLPATDIELTREVKKRDQPAALLALSRAKVDLLADRVHIYTDASRLDSQRVGAGCCVRLPPTGETIEHSARLTDGVSVYAGELAAIRLAYEYVRQISEKTGLGRFAIFSDSLSAIASIRAGRCKTRPNLFNDILHSMSVTEADVVLTWVPSHIGLEGNELADKLANIGANRPNVDHDIGLEIREEYSNVERYVERLWQAEWENGTTGAFFRRIEPNVRRSSEMVFRSRAMETMAHRLRLGACWVNACLHKVNVHETGLCDSCNVPETVQHFLLDCSSDVATALREFCENRGIDHTAEAILSTSSAFALIRKVTDRRL